MRCDPGSERPMIAALRQPRVRGPWRQLRAALMELARGHAELVSHAERPWASITFSGSRHHVGLRFSGERALEAGEHFIAALPDHEFAIARHLVADAAIVSVTQETLPEPRLTVETELLLLDDA